jgi:hypothetical protein
MESSGDTGSGLSQNACKALALKRDRRVLLDIVCRTHGDGPELTGEAEWYTGRLRQFCV